jgi:hypothetical protein
MTKKPTRTSLGGRLREFDRIGRGAFLKKYANGFGARAHFIRRDGRVYDMKAVWAAAHEPPVRCGDFNTSQPFAELLRLGFERVSAKDLSRSEQTQLQRADYEDELDRGSTKEVEQLFSKLWPNSRLRRAIAERLARSIQHANKCASGSWVLTVLDGRVRLNVGQVLVLQFDSKSLLAHARARRGKSLFAAVRVPSYAINSKIDDLTAVSQKDWQAHEEFILAAAESKRYSPWKDSLSEGALSYIEKVLDIKIPRPSNLKGQRRSRRFSKSEGPRLHILQGGITNGDKAWLEKAARQNLRRPTWTVPKSVQIGDQAIIHVSGEGFFATARVVSRPKPRRHWKNRYGASIDTVKLLTSPLSLESVKAKLPEFSWAKYPRSIHTVLPELAKKLQNIIAEHIAFEDQLQDIREIELDGTLDESERETQILARRGQGQYRKQLIELWSGCAVTKCGPTEILRASHIKPWKMCSSHEERLDKFNGLLLTPNLDALFDRALVSFDKQGRILISSRFPKKYWANLMISKKMKFAILPEHERYLRHHRMRFEELENGRQVNQ